jgi:hypothetical protein
MTVPEEWLNTLGKMIAGEKEYRKNCIKKQCGQNAGILKLMETIRAGYTYQLTHVKVLIQNLLRTFCLICCYTY